MHVHNDMQLFHTYIIARKYFLSVLNQLPAQAEIQRSLVVKQGGPRSCSTQLKQTSFSNAVFKG